MHRRPEDKAHGGLWEFPGGKIEAGEGARAALVREIAEECGLEVDPASTVLKELLKEELSSRMSTLPRIEVGQFSGLPIRGMRFQLGKHSADLHFRSTLNHNFGLQAEQEELSIFFLVVLRGRADSFCVTDRGPWRGVRVWVGFGRCRAGATRPERMRSPSLHFRTFAMVEQAAGAPHGIHC